VSRRPTRRPGAPAPRSASSAGTSRSPRGRRPARPAAAPRASALDLALAEALKAPEPEPRGFGQFGLPQALVTTLARRGVQQPFAIQARTLPDALAGHDVLGRAQTGSGKTLAFGVPMLTRLAASGEATTPKAPRGLVLVPTRELARQVADELAPLGHALGLRVTTVFGGAPMGRQIQALERGVDVVVATPGRLIDLLDRRAARMDRVVVSVLDEADHMADLGFLPAVTRILDETPSDGQRLLFSATLDRGVDKVVERYLQAPVVHAVASATAHIELMDHRTFEVDRADKVAVAATIAGRPARTLFFVRTKHGADRLARQLTNAGAAAAAIHGNLNQGQRLRALDAFASGRSRVLVATDVAARGIHVDDVDLVVHYDPANDHKDYLHRSGRTARAGAAGTVVSLAEPAQVKAVAALHAAAQVEAPAVAVHPAHPEVVELAASGQPIALAPETSPAPTTQYRQSRRQRRSYATQGQPARRGQRGGQSPTGERSQPARAGEGARKPRRTTKGPAGDRRDPSRGRAA
jgi:superfamily II DNA/RNA helicase